MPSVQIVLVMWHKKVPRKVANLVKSSFRVILALTLTATFTLTACMTLSLLTDSSLNSISEPTNSKICVSVLSLALCSLICIYLESGGLVFGSSDKYGLFLEKECCFDNKHVKNVKSPAMGKA